jgi:hypothetical protein
MILIVLVADTETAFATIAAGTLNRFDKPVPAPLFVNLIHEAFDGNVAPAPTSESA